MLRTLQNRLIFSHILPFLIIIPLTGIAILYALETQVFLPNLSKELSGEVSLLAQILSNQPRIIEDSSYARKILTLARTDHAARVMILANDGTILASSDQADSDRLGQQLEVPDFTNTPVGEVVSRINSSQRLHGEIVDAYAPIYTANNHIAGIVRMSYRFVTVYEEFMQLRFLIAGILVVSLLVGVLLGSILAININSPLENVIQAIYNLARGSRKEALTEQGPEEVRQLQHSVNHLMERLHNLEESRQRLLANLVHEIGRPLGALHASVQALLLTKKHDPQLLEEMLLGMKEETGRLQHLLDDLAHVHDQVLGTLELNLQSIAVSEWLVSVLSPWEAIATEKRLHWEISIPPDLPTIRVDPLRLAQVVGNLISNAIKYTPPGGSVSVTVGLENGIWIRVRDTGPGITADEQEKIFTPFYRGSQRGSISQGMGLGLSIARDLVIAHGGLLEVESESGLGSQFTIRLLNDSTELGTR